VSLDFTTSGSRINAGSATALDNLGTIGTAFTVWAWVYRTADGANQHIITKDGTFIAASHSSDVAGASTIKVFSGDLTTAVTEPTYSLQQTGSNGAPDADAAYDLYIGNLARATTLPFKGRIDRAGVVRRALTVEELTKIQFGTIPECNVPDTLVLYDINGTGSQADLSGNGNTGTVTTASVADGAPLIYPWLVRRLPGSPVARPAVSVPTVIQSQAVAPLNYGGSGGPTVPVPPPSSLQAGDIWVVWLTSTSTSDPTFDTPSGWTSFGAQVGNTTLDRWGQGFWKVASNEVGTTAFGDLTSGANTIQPVAISLNVRGVDPADVVEAYGTPVVSSASLTTITAPNIVPANNGCLLLAVYFYNDATGVRTSTPQGGFVAQETYENAVSTEGDFQIARLLQSTAASITPTTTISGGSVSESIAWALALNPIPVVAGYSVRGTLIVAPSRRPSASRVRPPIFLAGARRVAPTILARALTVSTQVQPRRRISDRRQPSFTRGSARIGVADPMTRPSLRMLSPRRRPSPRPVFLSRMAKDVVVVAGDRSRPILLSATPVRRVKRATVLLGFTPKAPTTLITRPFRVVAQAPTRRRTDRRQPDIPRPNPSMPRSWDPMVLLAAPRPRRSAQRVQPYAPGRRAEIVVVVPRTAPRISAFAARHIAFWSERRQPFLPYFRRDDPTPFDPGSGAPPTGTHVGSGGRHTGRGIVGTRRPRVTVGTRGIIVTGEIES
jgi:hypothetical protein